MELKNNKEKSEGYQKFLEMWDGVYQPNKSPKCNKLKKKLEENGHTNVYVWYERMGGAVEMCGCSGGYMYVSDQAEIYPLGYSFNEAIKALENPWHKESEVEL